jgi:hypothetical protein
MSSPAQCSPELFANAVGHPDLWIRWTEAHEALVVSETQMNVNGTGNIGRLVDAGRYGKWFVGNWRPQCARCHGSGAVVIEVDRESLVNAHRRHPRRGLFLHGRGLGRVRRLPESSRVVGLMATCLDLRAELPSTPPRRGRRRLPPPPFSSAAILHALQEFRLGLELAVGRFLFPGQAAEIRRAVHRDLHRMGLESAIEQPLGQRYRLTQTRSAPPTGGTVVSRARIDWTLARTWKGGRIREPQLKARGHGRHCPICTPPRSRRRLAP